MSSAAVEQPIQKESMTSGMDDACSNQFRLQDSIRSWIDYMKKLKGEIGMSPSSISKNLPKPEQKNYLLLGYQSIQNQVAPWLGVFFALSRNEQILTVGVLFALLWFPTLIAMFTILPAIIGVLVCFYMMFFDLGYLLKHLNEVVQVATGHNLVQLSEAMKGMMSDIIEFLGTFIENSAQRQGTYSKELASQAMVVIGHVLIKILETIQKTLTFGIHTLSNYLLKEKKEKHF